MMAPEQIPAARQYDPRQEQQSRLVDAAHSLGTRLVETLNVRIEAWLGPDLVLKLRETEIAYGPSVGEPGRIAMGLRTGPGTPRLAADSAFFFRYYECMLSGPSVKASKPRTLGPTETTLGAELGARWISGLPDSSASLKASDVWVLPIEDAPPLPGSAWPLLKLVLALSGEDEGCMEILVPLAMMEGKGAAAKAAAAKSASPAKRLGSTPVRLQAVLGTVRLRLKELYELRPGDCILLENGPADGAVVVMGKEPVFRARPGRNGRHLAVQVLGPVNHKNGG
jgi:flagellar motor switch protein FliM